MKGITLPISKSIANRILLLQAIHGDPLMRVSSDMPDDVIVLHDALQQIRDTFGTPKERIASPFREGVGITLNLKNCGTALRFLQVHLDKCYPGEPITLTGDARLMERKGKPTTQTTSALILHGEAIPVAPNESPYITMSRNIQKIYADKGSLPFKEGMGLGIERDWSSAAFWYEYIAIHGGELLLAGLTDESLQGDRIVADIYAQHFGVQTTFTPEGAILTSSLLGKGRGEAFSIDFTSCPDLYPAIALTCERLNIALHATGTERLHYKESDRIEAVQNHEVRNDHRMAMALIAADYITLPAETSALQTIIAKSYPAFVQQISELLPANNESFTCPKRYPHGNDTVTTRQRHGNETWSLYENVVPKRGINDDNKGKKHALSKLIHAAKAEYIWLHDDDVVWPKAANQSPITNNKFGEANLIILPLKMEIPLHPEENRVGILPLLQIAEYAAIQELTMRTAKAGKAVMCSGANLIVRREAWLTCEQDLHPEIPSGDDMFLLEAMKRRHMKIAVIDEPDYTAIVHPVTTWRAFFRQRMRWAGKAPKYTDTDIIRCGALVMTANLLQLLCPLIILIKFPIEYSLIRKRITPPYREGHGVGLFFTALLLEFLYPFYILACLIGGLIRKKKW
ncbi:MAG: glycosyltransferase [Paludibacteraceae bacterium]|nr:glycosyltransferase [Paludibacteraceae bacterium]